MGLQEAQKCLIGSESNYRKVIFLFSDGQANAGITSLDKMKELCTSIYETHNIHITTYGVGSGFNKEWMTKIANSGKGSYFYIDTKNKDNELTAVLLRRGFREFSKIMAKDISIRLNPENSILLSVNESVDLLKMLTPIKISSMTETDLTQYLCKVRSFPPNVREQEQPPNDNAPISLLKAFVNYTDYNGVEHKVVAECVLDRQMEISINSNTACLIYNTIVECGKLENEITELLTEGNRTKSVILKKKIIKNYEDILEQDKMGLIEKLLPKARETLQVMENESDIARVTKTHTYLGGYAAGCAADVGDEDEKEAAVCFGAGDMDAGW